MIFYISADTEVYKQKNFTVNVFKDLKGLKIIYQNCQVETFCLGGICVINPDGKFKKLVKTEVYFDKINDNEFLINC